METFSMVITATPNHEGELENVHIDIFYYQIDQLKGFYLIP